MTGSRLDEQPYLVVEELDPKYGWSLNKSSLKEPLLRSRRPYIKRVHVVQFGEFGCYVGKNFGRNPHYMIPFIQYETTIRRPCLLYDIHMVVYPTSKTISHSDLLVCFNFGWGMDTLQMCPQTKSIFDLVQQIQASSKMGVVPNEKAKKRRGQLAASVALEENAGSPIIDGTHPQELNQDEIRGARQQHYGYSSNYSLSRLPKDQGGLVCPRIVGGSVSPDCVPTFVGMTKLADAVYSHDCARKMRKEQGPGRLYDDER